MLLWMLFGMLMPGRKFDAGTRYRYGFNGKEKDDDTNGNGNEYDYGDRIYNPRIGRWLSIDKLEKNHPGESPYLYTGGNPIYFVDPDGKDRIEHTKTIGKDGSVLIKTQTFKGAYRSVWNPTYSGGGYYTKNDYEVYTTHDYRSGKDVVTKSSNTLYGSGHASEIGFVSYLKFKIFDDGALISTQLILYGSGTSDPGWGTKADPNRPIISIDFAAYNSIMSLVMTGISVPDLQGADIYKIPGIVDKARKEAEYKKNPQTIVEVKGEPYSEKVIENHLTNDQTLGNNNPINIKKIRNGPDGKPKDTVTIWNQDIFGGTKKPDTNKVTKPEVIIPGQH